MTPAPTESTFRFRMCRTTRPAGILAWGYLAHEAAHVRYTDFAVYEQAANEGPLQAMLQNRIEDVRIERELARPYPGTRATIATVLRRMLAEGRMSAPVPNDHPAQVLAAYLLLTLRHEVLGQRVLDNGGATRRLQILQAGFTRALHRASAHPHGRGAGTDRHLRGGRSCPAYSPPDRGRGRPTIREWTGRDQWSRKTRMTTDSGSPTPTATRANTESFSGKDRIDQPGIQTRGTREERW